MQAEGCYVFRMKNFNLPCPHLFTDTVIRDNYLLRVTKEAITGQLIAPLRNENTKMRIQADYLTVIL